ncbi:MAG TPA: exodeoxyribonuclease VII large subunit [Solirubrobacteraceae bacterium]
MTTPAPLAASETPADPGIPGSALAGPFPVGEYAAALRRQLRSFAHVQLVGELVNLRAARARVYFELRDGTGAISCAVWQRDWDQILARAGGAAGGGVPVNGMQVVIAGGCDFYPGSATSSPSFSFSVTDLRVAGEGDLLARIDRLRKALDAEGLLELQRRLPLPLLPRTIGVITGESGKARDDILAALHRRGWAGRLVWGFAPVQDRHAAPAIVRALGDLAAVGEVEVAIVARGGGSLADLLCFCDETLCRTVALLGVPVIASVGHHTDRTLLDDVAAVSCSTPTHAAEAAVGIDCRRARAEATAAAARLRDHGRRAIQPRASLPVAASRLRDHGRRAVLARARMLATLSRAPADHLARQRTRLHQQLREARAGSRRRLAGEHALTQRRALVLQRKVQSSLLDCLRRHPNELNQLALTLAAHDPQRTLERGYALVQSPSGEPISTAARARETADLRLRFADDTVPARVLP